MRRTVRQKSLPLSKGEWAKLVRMAQAYGNQKDAFLVRFGHIKHLPCLGGKRKVRDELLDSGFRSPFGLQARQWKLALEDALYTLERQWEAAIVEVKERLNRHRDLTDAEKHYAYWILYKHPKHGRDWKRLQAVFTGEDVLNEGIGLDAAGRAKIRKYLGRTFRRVLGKRPRVKKARSFTLDQQMYRVFFLGNRQCVAVATLEPGERVTIPLAGVHAMQGNLRVVLLSEEACVEIHSSRELNTYAPGQQEVGIDLGIQEVFTDDAGKKYRPEYGAALQQMSESISEKGKKRGRLWSLYRKLLESDKGKARRVLRHNLGFAKQRKRNQKYRVRCENEINRAFNELYRGRWPGVIAYEDLTHLRGKAKSRGLSRKVSMWQRSIIKERKEYKNHVFGVTDPGPQNAAYSSQACPECGWVDEGNREGDCFLCRKCGFAADADQVAARNLRGRLHDEEITRYTPYKKVKQILLNRYRQIQK